MIKKIGNDSLILITLKQGDDINNRFDSTVSVIGKLYDTIYVLKTDVVKFKYYYDSIYSKNITIKQFSDSIEYIYRQDKLLHSQRELYFKKREEDFKDREIISNLGKIGLVFLCIVFAAL